MKLIDLLKDIPVVQIVGDSAIEVTGIQSDSRRVEQGHAFVAQNIMARVNSHLIMVHRKTTAPCRINFPGRINTVVDIYNKKIVAKNVNSFVVDDKENTTSLFYYGDDAEVLLKKLKQEVK